MAGTANGKPKRSAPSPSGRANKKSKGDAIYDDPDAVLENNKSPLYEEDTDLMVSNSFQNITWKNLTYLQTGSPQSSQGIGNHDSRLIRATVSTFVRQIRADENRYCCFQE